MAEEDVHNYSSSPHRLPTLSASQALQNLSSTPRRPLSTGLEGLDSILQGTNHTGGHDDSQGGISRGEITEVYGPPGIGKTTFGLQIASIALRSGTSVVWVDSASNLVPSRLRNILGRSDGQSFRTDGSARQPSESREDLLTNFQHVLTPTLPHLLALLAHPSESFPRRDTSLIVIDTTSTLFALAFPRTAECNRRHHSPQKKSDAAQWASGRRWAVMSDLISKLGKVAVTGNVAILLLGQTITRVRSDTGALLYPSISGTAWDAGIRSRIVLFRDWLFQSKHGSSQMEQKPGVRFARVSKTKGVAYEGVGKVAAFVIEMDGLHEFTLEEAKMGSDLSSTTVPSTLKRKRNEIADSESEAEDVGSDQEFGWGDADEILKPDNLAE